MPAARQTKTAYPADSTLQPIAQVLKSYGTTGEVLISFLPLMPEDIDLNEPIFLFFEGLSVPFFIESFNLKGSNKALLKLEDIESLDEAEEIVGRKVFMSFAEGELYEEENSDEYTTALSFVGFTLINRLADESEIIIGVITGASDFGGSICLEVGESLYPYHQDLVVTSQSRKKTLTMRLPEGL